MTVNRRFVLKSLGLGAGAFMLAPWQTPKLQADPNKPIRNFIFCYFGGGWDTLISLDPRDPGKFSDSRLRETRIQLGYNMLPDPFKPEIIQPKGSRIEFGPVMGGIARHFDKMCLVRGVAMDTVSHTAGRQYFLTGMMPRGGNATGSSVPTWIVADQGEKSPIPNLVVGVQSYNRGLPTFATGMKVGSVTDLMSTLRDGGQAPDKNMRELIEDYRKNHLYCDALHMNRDGLFDLIRSEQKKARGLVTQGLVNYFNFYSSKAEMQAVRKRYGIRSLSSGEAQAAMAYQAIKHQVAQCVTIQLAGGLDTHGNNWATDQSARLYNGFKNLGILVDDLKSTDHPQGGKLIDHTTVVVFSEFGRTSLLNSNDGRDHSVCSSCMLIGAGVPHNTVVGRTSDIGFNPMAVNPNTGNPEDGGLMITPTRIMASLMKGADYRIDQFRVGVLPALINS